MEDPAQEQELMKRFLRYQHPRIAQDMARIISTTVYPRGTDVEEMTEIWYADLATQWKHILRRDAEYIAWRRQSDPNYVPPDEPDPDTWENLTTTQRNKHQRAELSVAQYRDRLRTLNPDQVRVFDHVEQVLTADQGNVHARLRRLASKGDPDLSAIAMATLDGLTRIENLLRHIASNGATLAVDENRR